MSDLRKPREKGEHFVKRVCISKITLMNHKVRHASFSIFGLLYQLWGMCASIFILNTRAWSKNDKERM